MKFPSFLPIKFSGFNLLKAQFKFMTTTSSTLSNLEIDTIKSISGNPSFRLLNLCKTLSSLQKIHALLIINGEEDDRLLRCKLIGLYASHGRVKHARRLFDEITDPDFVLCKLVIRWYFINDMYDEILGFYKTIRKTFLVLDNIVFLIVLKACTELRNLVEGRKLHAWIVQMGSPDSFVLTGLVDMYAKCGVVDTAHKVFEMIRDRNVVCWTSMIVGYVQNNCSKEALILFNRMRDCVFEGNANTLGSIVTACAKLGALHQGKWVHGYVIKNGMPMNSHLFTSVLDMYIKCGTIQDARLIFDEVSIIDLISWTAMITGYAQSGFAEEALLLFADKKWENVSPNAVTLASVISACGQSGYSALGLSIHGLGIKSGQLDANVMNALVDMYAKCRRIEDAIDLFESMEDKDIYSWNAIIYGYSQSGRPWEALRTFRRMRSNYIQLDPVTVVAAISSCVSLGDITFGSSLHAFSIRKGFLPSNNVYIGTSLLNLYAKCGDVKSAHSIFDGMNEKNAVTWNAMIYSCGKQGDSTKCLELFNDLLKENSEPTDIVFTSILSRCSHSGMIRQGWNYFDTMCREYDFIPSMRHYACIVDLFSRTGQLQEALEFIEKMPIQPDCSVFGAFLHGCSMHSRYDMGDVVVRKMLELHPDDAGHYLWSEAGELRDKMRSRGLRKSPGSSRVNLYIDQLTDDICIERTYV